MEMEMEVAGELGVMGAGAEALVDRLNAAAGRLEQAAERLAGLEVQAAHATHEAELERQLAEAEVTISALKHTGRKTSAAGGVASLIAKEGGPVETGALDAALVSLSVEQRIAVKAGLLRAGLVG